jgi:serine/threonine protein kinase
VQLNALHVVDLDGQRIGRSRTTEVVDTSFALFLVCKQTLLVYLIPWNIPVLEQCLTASLADAVQVGTRRYWAPEINPQTDAEYTRRDRPIDIFSLGYIFL